jgi:hypothetical protein
MRMLTIDEATLCYHYRLKLAGARCEVLTDSASLGPTLGAWHADVTERYPAAFSMQVAVKEGLADTGERPHFRGLHHIVIARFGAANLFVFDLIRHQVSATVSGSTARDRRFWDEILLPMAMGIFGATIGVVPVHCACLSDSGNGLLLAGNSGAGKSTLSVALAQAGFEYVSDDWTFLSREDKKLVANGISPVVKLLPDAKDHFPGLAEQRVRISLNGELAYEVAMADAFGVSITRQCEPRWFVFLERSFVPGSEFTAISPGQAREYIESSVERLPEQLAAAELIRAKIIGQISRLSCWTFRYGGTPQFAAQEVREFLCHQKQETLA